MTCPKSFGKFGFCGLLAVIYAAKLPMPANLTQLRAFFAHVKAVLSMKMSTWEAAKPRNQGGISFEHTLCLLRHYNRCGFEEVLPEDCMAGSTQDTHKKRNRANLARWLMCGLVPKTRYIVHVSGHAFFVAVGAVPSRWRIYDQRGVHRKADIAMLTKQGGYGRKLLQRVIRIT